MVSSASFTGMDTQGVREIPSPIRILGRFSSGDSRKGDCGRLVFMALAPLRGRAPVQAVELTGSCAPSVESLRRKRLRTHLVEVFLRALE